MIRAFAIFIGVAALGGVALADDAKRVPDYEHDIRPLLDRACVSCHSAALGAKRKGGLALDSSQGWARGGEHGPAVVPRLPEQSLLVTAVRYRDEELQMPPDEKLSDAEVRLLERWVAAGSPVTAAAPAGAAGDLCSAVLPGAAVRRVTRRQYENSVFDLLGVTSPRVAELPPDDRAGAFAGNSSVGLSPLALEKYVLAAEDVSRQAARQMPDLLGCPRRPDDRACLSQFINTLAPRFYRAPLAPREADRLQRLFNAQRRRSGPEGGWRALLEAVLLSPTFLYVSDPHHGRLAPEQRDYARAGRLSLLLWQGPPDDELLHAARTGLLRDGAGVRRQAERMLADGRGRRGLGAFVDQWLSLEDLPGAEKGNQVAPLGFDATFREAMMRDAREVFLTTFDRGAGDVASLLSTPLVIPEGPVKILFREALYEADSTAVMAGRIEGKGLRGGILTHPGFLAVHAHATEPSAVMRGRFIRERLLCQTMPPPPADANDRAKAGAEPIDEGRDKGDKSADAKIRRAAKAAQAAKDSKVAVVRERLTEARCVGCHRLTDPLGLVFESYDAFGRHRPDTEPLPAGLDLQVVGTQDMDGPLASSSDLIGRLATSGQVRSCFATQWWQYAIGQQDIPADACWVKTVADRFAASKFKLRDLVLAIVESPAFIGP